MKIIAHIGAHRTATTTFQSYVRQNTKGLSEAGLGFWGPKRLRKGLFSGIIPAPHVAFRRDLAKRARGRIALQCQKTAALGVSTLLISEENMIGSVRANLRARRLYPAIGERMSRYDWAFDGRIERVVLTIRSPEHWWSSAISYAVARGAPVPSVSDIAEISQSNRVWRDVITDLACAMPHAEICVLPFERFGAQPDKLLTAATGFNPRETGPIDWCNAAPDLIQLRRILRDRGEDADLLPSTTGRWSPFDDIQRAAMRELYADDLFWLTAGADGLATLTDETQTENRQDDRSDADAHTERGRLHDRQNRSMA